MPDTQEIKDAAGTSQARQSTGNSKLSARGSSVFSYLGFNKLFFGSLFGALGDRLYQMSLIASANIIFAGLASEDRIGNIQIVAAIPQLIFYPLSGSLIDKFDRRKLLVWVKALKVLTVLLFVPLLWHISSLGVTELNSAQKEHWGQVWGWCLAVVALMNIITVPFAPSRSAAIPDVVPEEHRSVGASLMATCGLISLLLGTFVGGQLARTDVLGPALTIAIGSALYVVAAVLFKSLPDAVAVPANQRAMTDGEKAADSALTFGAYWAGLKEGFVYCAGNLSIIGLIFFETVFWTIASAFYILVLFHARTVLLVTQNELTGFFSIGLGIAGIGLFGGAIGIGRRCRRISPILSYTPAFFLIFIGLYGVFHSQPIYETLADGSLVHRIPMSIYALMFSLGLGGGLVLGRVDADVLAIAEERMRGRIFAIKGMAFAATILITILLITNAGLSDQQKSEVVLWTPRIVFMLLPLCYILSWFVDIAIWAKRADTELPGAFHQFGYNLLRAVARLFFKVLFRYEVIGVENIPASGPLILAANHASFIDPLLLGCCTQRHVQFIMYSSYYRSLAHPIFRFLRSIPVDEKGQLSALKAGVRSLNQGACIGIFPEGRVSLDGVLQPPQGGALFLAQRSGALVVPVAIKGNYQAWPRHAWLPRMSKISIIVGKPFCVAKELSRKDTAEMADKLMADLALNLR